MVLLTQLFRHKSAPHDPHAAARPAEVSEDGGNVRGLGAIAAAVGVRRQDGMPAEFELLLGDLMARVPERFIWLGKHDERRVVRIDAVDIAPGLTRGRAEISLVQLVALAPDVFRWERGETDDPQIRLPIQKLLQQIGNFAAAMPVQTAPVPDEPAPVQEERAPISTEQPPAQAECAAAPAAVQPGEVVAEHLPSIVWNTPPEPEAPPAVEPPPPDLVAPPVEESPAVEETTPAPEPEIPVPSVKPLPPAAAEHQPTISVSATEPVSGPVELRPQNDVSTSTTLRAVVLGGVGPSVAAASSAPGFILAPRVTPVTGGAPPVILAPSVMQSATEGTASPAHRRPDFAGLQNLFMTGVALDLAGVAALAAGLPGVRACVITGTAGDAAAGNFSHGASLDEVRAASAEIARKGGTATDTLHRGESDIALFLHDGVCVAAVLAANSAVPGVRERLARVAELLAGTAPAR